VYHLLTYQAFNIKRLFSPEHVPAIVAHFEEFRPGALAKYMVDGGEIQDLTSNISKNLSIRSLNRLTNMLRMKLTIEDLANYNWIVDELTNAGMTNKTSAI